MKKIKTISVFFTMMLLLCMYKIEVSANIWYRFNAHQVSSIKLKNEKIKMTLDKKDLTEKKRTKGIIKDKHIGTVTFFKPQENIWLLAEDGEHSWKLKKLSYKKIKKILSSEREAYETFLDQNHLQPSVESDDKYIDYVAEKDIKTYKVSLVMSDKGKLLSYHIYGVRYGKNKGRTK